MILWGWKRALQERLATLRLTIHERSAQVTPTAVGIPWLGFVVYPEYRKVKGRKVRHATRRLGERYEYYRRGAITFAEFDAGVQGWTTMCVMPIRGVCVGTCWRHFGCDERWYTGLVSYLGQAANHHDHVPPPKNSRAAARRCQGSENQSNSDQRRSAQLFDGGNSVRCNG